MHKQEFLSQLQTRLSGLPQEEITEQLNFYREMIEDRMEEGLTEAEAVAAVGTADEIAGQIITDTPLPRPTTGTASRKSLKVWEIVLLVLGAPLWLSLLMAAFAVVLSLYISVWSVAISLWAVFVSFAACAVAGITAGTVFAFTVSPPVGIALIGTGILLAGLDIFLFFGCKAATGGILQLTVKLSQWLRNRFAKKEAA